MLSNLGTLRRSVCGSDVGGFTGDACKSSSPAGWQSVRYHRSSAVTFRKVSRDEPWAYEAENLTRPLIDVRYELLPYLYRLMEEATRTGQPIVRPLVYKWPGAMASWLQDRCVAHR